MFHSSVCVCVCVCVCVLSLSEITMNFDTGFMNVGDNWAAYHTQICLNSRYFRLEFVVMWAIKTRQNKTLNSSSLADQLNEALKHLWLDDSDGPENDGLNFSSYLPLSSIYLHVLLPDCPTSPTGEVVYISAVTWSD